MLGAGKILPQLKYILVNFFAGFTINLETKTVSFLWPALNQQVLLTSEIFTPPYFFRCYWEMAFGHLQLPTSKILTIRCATIGFLGSFSDLHSLTLSLLLRILLAFEIIPSVSHLTRKSKKRNQQSHIMIEPLSSLNKWFIVLSLKIDNTLFPCCEPCICSPFPSPWAKFVHNNVLYDSIP